jgi:lipopolysaccharide/colanic/teichoic acid biosynthesis glycosyltransferase
MAAALAILIDTGRPILFRQERVGRNFIGFQIVKFRTMRNRSSGPQITVRGDCRITRVGKVLRITKLDEFPQFWNVLRGDMSIVGPRPEVPEFVELYKERYLTILRVRPGITDLASIQFRHEETMLAQSENALSDYRDRILPIKLDLADSYLLKQSVLVDLSIIARTALATLRGSTSPGRH